MSFTSRRVSLTPSLRATDREAERIEAVPEVAVFSTLLMLLLLLICTVHSLVLPLLQAALLKPKGHEPPLCEAVFHQTALYFTRWWRTHVVAATAEP